MKLIRILFSLYYWIWFGVVSLVFLPIITLSWLLTFWWDPHRRWNNMLNFPWSRLYFLGNPLFWRTTVTGREKMDPHTPTLYVANHLSIFDIFAIFLLRRCFHWVSKASNRWVPVLGLNMIFTRTIFFDRENTREVIRMVKDSVKRLQEGYSLIIFPEGERSPNGRLQPFLAGAFSIAKRAKVRIQPIVITGTYKILPREQAIFNPVAHVTVTVLDPIPVETVMSLSTEELRDLVYEKFAVELPEDHLPVSQG